MSDLISREAICNECMIEKGGKGCWACLVNDAPTVDAVDVVRCGECIRRDICRTTNTWAVPPNDDWFCADGKRKEVSE